MSTKLAIQTPATEVPQTGQLRFIAGMPGLEQYTRFTLIGIDQSPVYWLQCEDAPEIALPVADVFAIEPAYSFDLGNVDAKVLGLEQADDALVLAVLNAPDGGEAITANLLAPLVVNRTSGVAKQVILDGSRHSLRHPVNGEAA